MSPDYSESRVRVPASTSNLGAGFDCFGLALQLYLSVKATIDRQSTVDCTVSPVSGRENNGISLTSDNLIYQAMKYASVQEKLDLPSVRLEITNDIPVSRGLGGSAAAIIAGIKLFSLLCNHSLSDEKILQYTTELEGHADNAAPSLLGGFVVNCITEQNSVISLRQSWPDEIKILVIVPELHLDTKRARAALADQVSHRDAVFNLQRSALFAAAIAGRRPDLLWEAMQDRLHQSSRAGLVPGLAEALATERQPGLLGIALSGAGPSVVALANNRFQEIGQTISQSFQKQGVNTQVLQLGIDIEGCEVLPAS